MAVNHPSYPQYFVISDERVRLGIAAIAIALTIALIVFIKAGMTVPADRDGTSQLPTELLVVPVQPAPPSVVSSPTQIAAPRDPSAPPPPAPASPVLLPEADIVLAQNLVPSTDIIPVVPSRLVGDGTSPSAGEGEGNGRGATLGDGSGAAVVAGPPADLRVSWSPRMRMRRLRPFYPRESLAARVSGLAVLDCEVLARDRVRDCRVMSEYPTDHGFGEAALAAQHVYRVRVHDQDGNRLYNQRFRLRAHFRPGN